MILLSERRFCNFPNYGPNPPAFSKVCGLFRRKKVLLRADFNDAIFILYTAETYKDYSNKKPFLRTVIYCPERGGSNLKGP